MTKANDSIHPIVTSDPEYNGSVLMVAEGGLTKREYFAAMAMAGMVANDPPQLRASMYAFAQGCVMMADALVAALNEPVYEEVKP